MRRRADSAEGVASIGARTGPAGPDAAHTDVGAATGRGGQSRGAPNSTGYADFVRPGRRVAQVTFRTLTRGLPRQLPGGWLRLRCVATPQGAATPHGRRTLLVDPQTLDAVTNSLGVDGSRRMRCTARLIRDLRHQVRESLVVRLAWPGAARGRSTAVLKRVHLGPTAGPPREPAVYASGILAGLPAPLAAPRCWAAAALPDGGYEVWLEDVHRTTRPVRRRSEDMYRVGWALGRLNGERWLDALPACDLGNLVMSRSSVWLSDEGWKSCVRRDGHPTKRIEAFLSSADRLLDAFRALPTVWCHQDATRLNVRLSPDGAPGRVVLLDWDLLGRAPLGQELVPLIWPRCEQARAAELEAWEQHAWRGYLAGLASCGCPATARDSDALRLAYCAAVALRYVIQAAKSAHPHVVDLVLRRAEEAQALVRG